MARLDRRNRAKFWVDPDLGGVGLLRAAFGTLAFSPHVHGELVIAVTEAGAGRCVTRGVSDVGIRRSLMIFNPGEPHAGGVAGDTGWHYRGLYLDDAALARLGETLAPSRAGVPYFRSSVVTDGDLADLFVRAHQAFEDGEARLVRESLFLAATAQLFARHGALPPLPAAGRERGPIARVLDHMRGNFTADLTIDELAACAALSPFHFIRSFGKATGLPPHAYLIQLRLARARRLLAGGQSPSQVALAVGFYDQSQLIRHFKRTYGITPGQYRAALLA